MKTVIYIGMLCMCLQMIAQKRVEKISQSINVNDEVTIDLNTSYTNLIIDTWNKDIIEVEAYVESDNISEDELKKMIKSWNIDVDGTKDHVSISTGGKNTYFGDYGLYGLDESREALKVLEMELAQIPEMIIVPPIPNLGNIPAVPEMPPLPELPKGMEKMQFDYDRYQKEGEVYMNKWSEEYEKKYGDEYAKKMEEWAKKWENSKEMKEFQKHMEEWGQKFGKEFGEQYGKDMEKWGEEFGKKMEAWGEQFGRQMEQRTKAMEKRELSREKAEARRESLQAERERIQEQRHQFREDRNNARFHGNSENSPYIKTIKIKIPKKAKLNMNVRHGELKFASIIHNLQADLSHTALVANSIDGSHTSINVSYAPVKISQWLEGELSLKYVDHAEIASVDRLVLSSNSSNVKLTQLDGNAIIDGSFGDLMIEKIGDNFNNINIVLENSEALLILPTSNYNLQFKGNQSLLSHPKKKNKEMVTSFSTGDLSSGKTIVVNAKFSEVVMQ